MRAAEPASGRVGVAVYPWEVGIALQSLDARHSHEDDTLRPGLLLGLIRRPRWLLGGIISFLGWPLQGYALAQAPLADASFFPSIGAVNPTLTIIANALRVADIIRERL